MGSRVRSVGAGLSVEEGDVGIWGARGIAKYREGGARGAELGSCKELRTEGVPVGRTARVSR